MTNICKNTCALGARVIKSTKTIFPSTNMADNKEIKAHASCDHERALLSSWICFIMLVTRVMLDTNFNLCFVSIAHNRFYRPLEDIKVGGNVWLNTLYNALQLILFNCCHDCNTKSLTCLVCFLQNAVTSIAKRKESCKEDRKVN